MSIPLHGPQLLRRRHRTPVNAQHRRQNSMKPFLQTETMDLTSIISSRLNLTFHHYTYKTTKKHRIHETYISTPKLNVYVQAPNSLDVYYLKQLFIYKPKTPKRHLDVRLSVYCCFNSSCIANTATNWLTITSNAFQLLSYLPGELFRFCRHLEAFHRPIRHASPGGPSSGQYRRRSARGRQAEVRREGTHCRQLPTHSPPDCYRR